LSDAPEQLCHEIVLHHLHTIFTYIPPTFAARIPVHFVIKAQLFKPVRCYAALVLVHLSKLISQPWHTPGLLLFALSSHR
jgi:hypothetical protein